MSLNDLTAYPESEASSTDPLCCVERLEDATCNGSRHTTACICNRDHQPRSARGPVSTHAAAQQETPSPKWLHGIDGVADKVAEHLSNFPFKASDRLICTFALFDVYVGVYYSALEQGDDAVD